MRLLQVKAEAVRREEERAKKLKEEADRKAELQKVRMRIAFLSLPLSLSDAVIHPSHS